MIFGFVVFIEFDEIGVSGIEIFRKRFFKVSIHANEDYFEKILGIRMGTVLGILY